MTRDEIIETLKKGIDLLEEQVELQKEIDETFALIGVELCGECGTISDCLSSAAKKNIQLYKGIEQLAEALGVSSYHPRVSDIVEPNNNQLAFVFGKYEIFQYIKESKDA